MKIGYMRVSRLMLESQASRYVRGTQWIAEGGRIIKCVEGAPEGANLIGIWPEGEEEYLLIWSHYSLDGTQIKTVFQVIS